MTRTEPEPQSTLPEELTAFLAELPTRKRSRIRESMGPGPDGYAWQLQLEPSNDAIDVSLLAQTDILVNVRLTKPGGSNTRTVELKNVPQDRVLHLQLSHPGAERLKFFDLHGQVNITGVEEAAQILFSDSCDGTVHFGSGTFEVLGIGETPPQLFATAGARLTLQNAMYDLRVSGECELRRSQVLQRLIVDEEASIALPDQLVAANSIEPGKGTAKLTVWPGALGRPKPPIVSVSSIANVSLHYRTQARIKGSPELQIGNRATNVSVAGPFKVTLKKWSITKGLESTGEAVLLAEGGAVLDDLSGDWDIEKAVGAHLLGKSGGFGIKNITSTNQRAAVARSVLVGFRLPERTTRRRVLDALDDTYHLDPYAKDLPGSGPNYHERRPFHRKLDDRLRETLPEDAEFMRELARLAREKGAPGSTRTRIAWCAYRLRHLSSPNWWDRRALFGYRLLGYGERPGPAFLTWIVLAVMTTVVTLRGRPFDLSPGSIWTFVDGAIAHTLGPVGALLQTGVPETEGWQYALRTLVAIPLVTGALALRNYVKLPRR